MNAADSRNTVLVIVLMSYLMIILDISGSSQNLPERAR